jgi:hypothetical protein
MMKDGMPHEPRLQDVPQFRLGMSKNNETPGE